MTRRMALCLAMLAAACAQTEVRAPNMDDARSLAASETAFAAHSVREDSRAAFLANFADDGVFVRGGWTNARESLLPRKAAPILLEWRPVFTEVAASGDMGLSTGPSKITSKADATQPPGYGQYVSVWKRAPGEPWKVAVDLGIAHPQPVFWDKPLEMVAVTTEPAAADDTIEHAEQQFAADAKAGGERAAYAKHGSASLRLYRPHQAPMAGKETALAWQGLAGEHRAWTVEKAEAARSNDFGYARGAYHEGAGENPGGWYLRVWHREAGAWRIAMDVSNPAR